jgi:hypothetical protein
LKDEWGGGVLWCRHRWAERESDRRQYCESHGVQSMAGHLGCHLTQQSKTRGLLHEAWHWLFRKKVMSYLKWGEPWLWILGGSVEGQWGLKSLEEPPWDGFIWITSEKVSILMLRILRLKKT